LVPFLASRRGSDFALELCGVARLRGEAPHRVLGLDRLSQRTALTLDTTVWRARMKAVARELDVIMRNQREESMGIDTITRVLVSMLVKLAG
jgi:hypothetical protein